MANPERRGFLEKAIDVGNTLDVVGFIWGVASGNVGLMVISLLSFGAGKMVQRQLRGGKA